MPSNAKITLLTYSILLKCAGIASLRQHAFSKVLTTGLSRGPYLPLCRRSCSYYSSYTSLQFDLGMPASLTFGCSSSGTKNFFAHTLSPTFMPFTIVTYEEQWITKRLVAKRVLRSVRYKWKVEVKDLCVAIIFSES